MHNCFLNKKNLKLFNIALLSFCLHFSSVSQKKLEFEILFGTYTNDHYNRKFDMSERKWILKKETLIYFVDAHNKRYSDTLNLEASDMDSIIKYIKENKLTTSIIKNLDKAYLDKFDWTANISGKINLNGKNSTFSIRTNSSTVLDEDEDIKRLRKLEEMLYKIIEDKKKKVN